MDRARIEDLWSRFLAGAPLRPEEELEVADALDADPRLLAEFSQDLKLDGSLRGIGRAERDADAFVESFSDRLRMERDGTRFIATVKQKMKRSRKPPTRRWEVSEWSGARMGVAAAVLLAFAGLLFAAASSGAPARKPEVPVTRRVPERTTPVEPSPEAPRPERPPAPEEKLQAPPAPRDPAPPPPPSEKKELPAPPAPAVAENREKETPAPLRETIGTSPRTQIAAATFTRVAGDLTVASAEGRMPAKAGQKLFAGQAVESAGPKSGGQLQFADGTRVDLGGDTTVTDIAEAEGPKGRGKRIVLARGQLGADVAKQPAEQPLLITTPHGEAKVLGTVFRISVDGTSTRLDVKEGRVRLTRGADQKSVDVPAGCFAAASAGAGGEFELSSEHKLTMAFQDGVSPTPRYAGTSDTILSETPKLADKAQGTYTMLWVDGDTTAGDDRYVLLRWDVSALPPRCMILSATIEVQVTNDSRGNPFELYEVKRDWVEKEATWKSCAAKLAWQAAGVQGAQDRGSAVLGMLAPRSAGAHTIRLTPEGVAAVQAWVDAPASNHGLLIANTDNADAVGFHAREASVAANRPRLAVTFLPRAKDSSPK